MPIKGLTDRGLAFPQIGVLRKGAPKDPSGNKPGQDLKYFRVVFDEAEKESAQNFLAAYGQQPARINIMFPFNDLDQIAQFWLEAYTAGRMVARSDGRTFQYLVNTETGEVVVKNGLHVKTGEPVPYKPDEPVGWYKNQRTNKMEPILCKGVGRIRIVVPELHRFAYLLLMTTSVHDIANLSDQLQAIWEGSGHRIAGIPLILQRKPRMVSCPDTNDRTRRVRREKWLLSIEPNPDWVERRLEAMNKSSFLFEQPRSAPRLNAPSINEQVPTMEPSPEWTDVPPSEDFTEDEESFDGEFYEDRAEEGAGPVAAAPEPEPGNTSHAHAPDKEPLRYEPEALKARLVEIAKSATGSMTAEKKGVIVTCLEASLSFTTDPKASRKMLLKYLTGHDSLTELNDGVLLSLYAWLAPHKNETSKEWFASDMAAREAVAAFNAAQPAQQSML